MSAPDFASEWARCSPWIADALEHCGNTHSLADVHAAVRSGDARFWAGERSAIITQRESYPNFAVLVIWLGGGDLEEIRDVLVPAAERYGREHGCRKVMIFGRPGWSRALGYTPVFSACGKEL